MATGTFKQAGRSIDYTPGADVAAGDIVVQGQLFGVAKMAILANALGAIAVQGVFDLPKATGSATALTVGQKVYWDSANSVVFTTADSNVYIGKVVKAAADADETVEVRLDQ